SFVSNVGTFQKKNKLKVHKGTEGTPSKFLQAVAVMNRIFSDGVWNAMSNIKLVIGNKNYSSWSMRPWLLLKAFDIPFEEINIALYQDNTAEKLGPYSPSLKVPALLHNETTVWDSLAVCEYISEQLLDGRGWPANPKKRASARS